ncbi:hypothetical protein CCP4SC76_5750007 [Gammaproteobacteria bacterium]
MKCVTLYEAEDGQRFETLYVCQDHEKVIEVKRKTFMQRLFDIFNEMGCIAPQATKEDQQS